MGRIQPGDLSGTFLPAQAVPEEYDNRTAEYGRLVSEDMLREEMKHNHVRHDAFEVLDRTPDLAPPGTPPLKLSAA